MADPEVGTFTVCGRVAAGLERTEDAGAVTCKQCLRYRDDDQDVQGRESSAAVKGDGALKPAMVEVDAAKCSACPHALEDHRGDGVCLLVGCRCRSAPPSRSEAEARPQATVQAAPLERAERCDCGHQRGQHRAREGVKHRGGCRRCFCARFCQPGSATARERAAAAEAKEATACDCMLCVSEDREGARAAAARHETGHCWDPWCSHPFCEAELATQEREEEEKAAAAAGVEPGTVRRVELPPVVGVAGSDPTTTGVPSTGVRWLARRLRPRRPRSGLREEVRLVADALAAADLPVVGKARARDALARLLHRVRVQCDALARAREVADRERDDALMQASAAAERAEEAGVYLDAAEKRADAAEYELERLRGTLAEAQEEVRRLHAVMERVGVLE